MQVLLHDHLGRWTLRQLRPWHRVLARSRRSVHRPIVVQDLHRWSSLLTAAD